MSEEQSILGVIFDLDGTLYRLGRPKLRMTLRLLGSLRYLRKMSAARASLRNRKFLNRASLMEAFYDELSKLAGGDKAQAAKWFEEKFMIQFVNMLGTSARKRCKIEELLEYLRARRVGVAVFSDFGMVAERLEALGIPPDYFDYLIAAEDYGVLKPAPEPLLDLAGKWGVAPSALVMVGDRLDLDAECARLAGVDFLGVTDSRRRATGADFFDWNTASLILKRRVKEPGVTI